MADKIESVAVGNLFTQEFLQQFQGPEGKVIEALARAKGELDALAYAALVEHLSTGDGADSIVAKAAALAGRTAEARGVSIGDEIGSNPDPVGQGVADLGAGNDTVSGRATAQVTGDGRGLFSDANGVIVDRNSSLDTGAGNDTVSGAAAASNSGTGGPGSAVVADGIENRGTLTTGAGDDVIRGAGKTDSNQAFSVAGGIDNGLGSTQAGFAVAPLLDTGAGADKLIGSSESVAVGDNAFAGGIENFGKIVTGADGDSLVARAKSVLKEGESGDLANADGIDNRTLGDPELIDKSGIIETGGGDDLIDARVSARAEGGNADAIGIRNDLGLEAENTIDLGAGNDKMVGVATGVATNGNATAVGISGGTIETDLGVDSVTGVASATGAEDVGATGALFVDADTGQGADVITGRASATGVGTADVFGIAVDARGISVGLSNIDDDSLQNPNNPDGPVARAGALSTGDGDDHIIGRAHTTADVGEAEELFFANATAFTNDGGTLEDLASLGVNLRLLRAAVEGKLDNRPDLLKKLTDQINDALPHLDTGDVDLGAGNDMIDVAASITVNGGQQGGEGGDEDLEVFVEGVENSGEFLTGDGNDSIVANVSGTSVGGAKILVEGIDNSGVGVSTGLNLPDQVNDLTLLDMGAGNDSIRVTTNVVGQGDLAAGDGIDTRSNLDMGSGNDRITLNVTSEFIRTRAAGDQEEGIADGIENRGKVWLGAGDDTVKATVQASGNGILTIAEGIESRNFFDAGSGDDTLNLTARATSTRGVLKDNLTQAAGLQTEQIDSGTFLLGDGHDEIVGRGIASSDGLNNKSTLAFGITQVTGDASNANEDGLFDAGTGRDTITGIADATGETDVEAFGVLFTNGDTGAGSDTVNGRAVADGKNFAQANGVAVGVSNNVPGRDSPLPDEVGTLVMGGGDDAINGKAHANTTSGRDGLLFNDVDAVLVDLAVDPKTGEITTGTLDTGAGHDTITGHASAIDNGRGGNDDSAVVADGVENRGTLSTGAGDDVIKGSGETHANQAFAVAGGIDNGLGSTQAGFPVTPELSTGDGADKLIGSAESSSVGANAFAGGIENFGTIATGAGGDLLQARAKSLVTDSEGGDLSNADGIDNRGLIETGSGNDELDAMVTARAEGGVAVAVAIRNDLGEGGVPANNMIDLGSGNDVMAGEARAVAADGVARAVGVSGGTIDTGAGNDVVTGTAAARADVARAVGVFLDDGDLLSTGNGNDFVSGEASAFGGVATAFGIAGGGTINTGNGKDTVYASSFGEGVQVHTGNGKDTVTGFGEATVDGGNGKDRLVMEFDFFGEGGVAEKTRDGVDFTLDGVTMETRDFEEFEIDGKLFDHSDILLA